MNSNEILKVSKRDQLRCGVVDTSDGRIITVLVDGTKYKLYCPHKLNPNVDSKFYFGHRLENVTI